MASKAKQHPPWTQPAGHAEFSILNSLTSSVVPFVPQEGRVINWYACGPTVYDSAHLGHARAYVTFDIVHRLLQDYFGFSVNYVMNITDIDDKIILRARRNYLLEQYKEKLAAGQVSDADFAANALALLNADVDRARAAAQTAQAALDASPDDPLTVKDLREQAQTSELKLKNAQSSLEQFTAADAGNVAALLAVAKDSIAADLDRQFGDGVTDHSIYERHARYFEQEFKEDMRTLNVLEPRVLTRVTEYVPQVVAFVQGIVANGFGYVAGGSVYFDVRAFSETHDYAKLRPWSVGNLDLLADGEGALAATEGKRHPSDFALWKASKPGEPSWESPWGQGRPGWHIECSAMAADIIGETMDIHSGGEDLCFPHHDNEMAQAEAFYNNQQWVNYFLHAGHLHIEGLKMSKSLKNFYTIREVLDEYSPRQIRLLFLLQSWHSKMNFSNTALDEAKAKEKAILEFFMNTKATVRAIDAEDGGPDGLSYRSQLWTPVDREFHRAVLAAQTAVDAALRDNLDYPAAMMSLFELIKATNVYMTTAPKDEVKPLLLTEASAFVGKILRIVGFETGSTDGPDIAGKIAPVIDVLAAVRDSVRAIAGKGGATDAWKPDVAAVLVDAREKLTRGLGAVDFASDAKWKLPAGGPASNVLERATDAIVQQALDAMCWFAAELAASKDSRDLYRACDQVRDTKLVDLGVRIEDAAEGSAPWKLDDPERLKQEREEATSLERAKALKTTLKKYKVDLRVADAGSLTPQAFFASEQFADRGFTAFDETGLPSHVDGEPIPDKKLKKLKKMHATQTSKRAKHDALLEAYGNPEDLVGKLRALVQEAEQAMA